MALARAGLSVAGLAALACGVTAGATVWLFLTDPVGMAAALDHGGVSRLLAELGDIITAATLRLVSWL